MIFSVFGFRRYYCCCCSCNVAATTTTTTSLWQTRQASYIIITIHYYLFEEIFEEKRRKHCVCVCVWQEAITWNEMDGEKKIKKIKIGGIQKKEIRVGEKKRMEKNGERERERKRTDIIN